MTTRRIVEGLFDSITDRHEQNDARGRAMSATHRTQLIEAGLSVIDAAVALLDVARQCLEDLRPQANETDPQGYSKSEVLDEQPVEDIPLSY